MTTAKMMREAIKTAHDECDKKFCRHEEAIRKTSNIVNNDVAKIICTILSDRRNDEEITNEYAEFLMSICKREFALVLTIWDCGFHAGYRLKELEIKKEEVAELVRITKK